MNAKILFKILFAAVALEIIYFCSNSNILWQLVYLNLPTFCTSFGNVSRGCSLDYTESDRSFLKRYEKYCEENFEPSMSSYQLNNPRPRCLCIPNEVKHRNLSKPVAYEKTKEGLYEPKYCDARHRTAIIIPFRNRERHLKFLLKSLHIMLQRQHLAYQIFVIEQHQPPIFNKAVLMNSGFLEILKNYSRFDCYIFHDVDMIPMDEKNFYVCIDMPRHVGGFIDVYDFKLLYAGIFGGVTAFTREQFQAINGFSNQFYGWGGEDDDILQRIKAKQMTVNRFPTSVSKFIMLRHRGDPGNPGNEDREMGYQHNPTKYLKDGLNSINYTVERVEQRVYYTWMHVSIPKPPKTLKTYDRSHFVLIDAHTFFRWFFVFVVMVILALVIIYYSTLL